MARSITKQRVRRGSRNDDKLIGQFALLRKMQEVGMVSRGKAAAVGMIALIALTACQQTPTPSSQAAQQDPVVKGYRSFCSLSEGKLVCILEAPNKDSVSSWFKKMNVPFDSISQLELEGERGTVTECAK